MSHTGRQLDIAIALREADPNLSAVDAIARAAPLEARGRRQQLRRYLPWWSRLIHLGLILYTHGGWIGLAAVHLVWARYQVHKWTHR